MTTDTSTDTRVDPPLQGTEVETLRGFLDYHRDTLRRKTEGLTNDQLSATHPPSTMTLGGLLKHLALVEDWWFSVALLDNEAVEPWKSVDWDADGDWEWHSAFEDSPEELRRLFDDAVAASDRNLERMLAEGGLDTLAARPQRSTGERVSLRWILTHMVEEYARHNGHADLIRESIDGVTGE
jgi:uncharacterized damage-inducible protein DinB